MSDDNFDDDHVDFDDVSGDGGFENFDGGGTTLGDMWRNNPLVKVGVIAGGLVTVVGAIILFGGGDDLTLRSHMRGGVDESETPGSGPLSQVMRDAVEETNVQRTEAAVREGGSAIPTPVDTPVRRLELPEEKATSEDPLERWRRIQSERQRQMTRRVPKVDEDPNIAAINALANIMVEQMSGILESKEPIEPQHILVTDKGWMSQEKQREVEGAAATQVGGSDSEEIVNILIPAGEIEYAQLITEASSDVEGPILARLASGPLAGAKLLGTFKTEDEFLVMSFNTIVIDGIAHATEAVALNPDTTSLGMATDVDHRYFKRIILPAAAAFVQGMGEAIVSTNETTVVVDGGAAVSSEEELSTREEFFKGFQVASEKVGELLDEEASETEILVRVEAGTPMGLLFIEPVTDESS